MSILKNINSPSDIKELDLEALNKLATEIREFIITTTSVNGGHLAPSLGVVELTLALHKVFNSPEDKIIWDVGHQAYAHKIITGRKDRFSTLRKMDGISGFPKRSESIHDIFDVGHASTSISAATGCAVGRDINGRKNKVVAVIGDGSMTGGIAFEGMNHAGHLNRDMVVVLNDNEMSIAENVGALSTFLTKAVSSQFVYKVKKDIETFLDSFDSIGKSVLKMAKKAEESLKGFLTPGMLFEAFGFEYIGPIDGHDLEQLTETLEKVRYFNDAVLIHVLTKKGKGYPPAEANPSLFHGVGPFDIETGKVIKVKTGAASYTSVFGQTLSKMAAEDDKVVAVTAAMPDGTGLSSFLRDFPGRFFDVGIAEQHAVTFAAGMATEGCKPVVAVYSSFLQRAFDQVFHDVCLMNLPVTFAIDRAGVVGSDGPTHHGVFDLSYLRILPNMTIMAPKDENELQHLLYTAINSGSPMAVRYPRGNGLGVPLDQEFKKIEIGSGEILRQGSNATVIAVGNMVAPSLKAADMLAFEGIELAVINARFIKPLDKELITSAARDTRFLITVEENVLSGGFGSAVMELLETEGITEVIVKRIGYPDRYIEQGEQNEIHARYRLDSEGLKNSFRSFVTKA